MLSHGGIFFPNFFANSMIKFNIFPTKQVKFSLLVVNYVLVENLEKNRAWQTFQKYYTLCQGIFSYAVMKPLQHKIICTFFHVNTCK